MDGAVSHTVVEKLMKSPEKEMKITDAGYGLRVSSSGLWAATCGYYGMTNDK